MLYKLKSEYFICGEKLPRIALGLEYNGSNYFGWQKQKDQPSVQEKVENALSIIANEEIRTFCASRTDSGVHALEQVIHFQTNSNRSISSWILGTNTKLPKDISIRWAKLVSGNFHARFSAIARRYHYIIYNHHIRSALSEKRSTQFFYPLNLSKMIRASESLIGENDFTSFRSSNCQSRTPNRKIHYLKIKKFGRYLTIDIKANSFLHHMVRNIVGSLLMIGCGKKRENWIIDLLKMKDRTLSGPTVPPDGLYLYEVFYPSDLLLSSSFSKRELINFF